MMKTIRKKSTPIRLGIIVLFYVAACVWITPHGFDMTDSGALLTQYAMPLDITRPISIGTFYTVWVGHWIHGLLPFGQMCIRDRPRMGPFLFHRIHFSVCQTLRMPVHNQRFRLICHFISVAHRKAVQ